MCSSDPAWLTLAITWAYRLGAYPGLVLVIATMSYTVHDEINRVASQRVRWLRQVSFTVMAVLLVNGLTSDASRLAMVLNFWSGIIAIVINIFALRERASAETGEQTAHAEPKLD